MLKWIFKTVLNSPEMRILTWDKFWRENWFLVTETLTYSRDINVSAYSNMIQIRNIFTFLTQVNNNLNIKIYVKCVTIPPSLSWHVRLRGSLWHKLTIVLGSAYIIRSMLSSVLLDRHSQIMLGIHILIYDIYMTYTLQKHWFHGVTLPMVGSIGGHLWHKPTIVLPQPIWLCYLQSCWIGIHR